MLNDYNIAEIIVTNSSINLDKIFHYRINDEMIDKICIGMRVMVPFGPANKKTEAFVINIVSKSTAEELKFISSIIDEKPLFNKKMVELIKWMRDRYICSYYDAIKAVLPPGIGLKLHEWISLADELTYEEINDKIKNSKIQQEIVRILRESGSSIEYSSLRSLIQGIEIRQAINSLLKKKVISIYNRAISGVKDKTIRMVSLSISNEEAEDYLADLSERAHVQAKVIEILMQNDSISAADVVAFTGGSYSTLNALIKKGILKYTENILERKVETLKIPKETKPFKPTNEQANVINSVIEFMRTGGHARILLRGVTGSGKTEVYLQIIAKAIEDKKQAIVLVPEISLTPQMVERFAGRFGSRVAVFHSALSLGERYDQWKKIRASEVDVVVGARSAIFAPFNNLGIIIVDEEHENTYKSEISPRYHAREVALWRGINEEAIVLFSSATPSVESYYKAIVGKYKLLSMESRYNNAALPKVSIIDMRAELANGNRSVFSNSLRNEIERNLENKQQTILFINRRGHSTFVSCRSCGYVCICPHCNISLTYHAYDNALSCHYCGYRKRNVTICPSCGSKYIRYFGIGTQKVEQELKTLFSQATMLRMDVDTTGKKYSHEKILNTFSEEKIDILIGTQMVSKGLDFPNVTLIGVLAADMSLNIDDYRSAERTFQLLTQVSGRAGRGEIEGRAIIQTYEPDNYTIRIAKEHDYLTFFNSEIKIRKQMMYPPFSIIISLYVSGPTESDVSGKINGIVQKIKEKLSINVQLNTQVYDILGPLPAPIKRIKNKFRYRCIFKCKDTSEIREIFREILHEHYKKTSEISVIVDINAVNMF